MKPFDAEWFKKAEDWTMTLDGDAPPVGRPSGKLIREARGKSLHAVMVERGLAYDMTYARHLIRDGLVHVDEKKADDPYQLLEWGRSYAIRVRMREVVIVDMGRQ